MTTERFVDDLATQLIKRRCGARATAAAGRVAVSARASLQRAARRPARFAAVEAQVDGVRAGTPAAALRTRRMVHAGVAALPAVAARHADQAQLVDRSTRHSTSRRRGNSEVLFAWLRVAIRNRYEPALPGARAVPDQPGPPQVRSSALRRSHGLVLGET